LASGSLSPFPCPPGGQTTHRSLVLLAPWGSAWLRSHQDKVRAALDRPGPALVDCVVNPHEPPLPGKIEFKQAKGFAEAFLRGQPDKLATARILIKDQVDKLRG
jgi:hypothetical protein